MTRTATSRIPRSTLLSICLVAIASIVALMPLHAFLSTWGGTAIGPLLVWKSWKEILLIAISLLFVAWLVKVPSRLKLFMSDRFVAVIGLYALLTLIDAGFHLQQNGLEATAAGLAMNLRYPLIAVLAYGVFRFSDIDFALWRRYAARFLVGAGTVLAILGIAQVTVIPSDFLAQFGYDKETTIAPFTLIDENPDAMRAFATLRGPNDFGAFLILPLILAVMALKKHRLMIVPVVVMALGIGVSSSRSAWIGTLIALLTLVVLMAGRKVLFTKKALIGIAAGGVVGLVLLYASLTIPAVRLAVFHSSPGDSSLTEGSTNKHWEATYGGMMRVINNPLGCGPGCSGPASYYGDEPYVSENYYVQIAEETGISGVFLWLVMIAIVGRRLYRARGDWMARALLASGIGLSAIGVWLHVWSDDPLSLTWWALVGMVLGNIMRTQSSKTTKKPVL